MKTGGMALASIPFISYLRFQDVAYKLVKMRRGVGIFYERGGTIGWYQTKKGAALVDAQFPDTAEHLVQALALDSGQPIDLLWNTHHHGDHTAGNTVLQEYVDKIVAHKQVPVLQQRQIEDRGENEDDAVYASTLFDEELAIEVGRENLKGYHFGAAHTGGDSVVHFEKANIVHVGDLVFNQVYPYIDFVGGADLQGWISALTKIESMFDNDTQYIFGHSDSVDMVTGGVEDLAQMRGYLETLAEQVGKAKRAGKTMTDILAMEPIVEGRRELWQGAWKHNLEAAYHLL